MNTRLWPSQIPSPGGPFPHKIRLCLSLSAERVLTDYCNERGLSPSQAVRAIFRRWADEPVTLAGVGARGVRAADAGPRERIPRHLPDLRPEAQRKRKETAGEGNWQYHKTVLVTWLLSVALDDTAYQGLLRYMRRTGLNHQDAARALITAAGRALRTD
jgi:hypothetical protein